MPTSFPRAYPEVRFPEEFSILYNKPKQYYPDTVRGGSFFTPLVAGDDENSRWHILKHQEAQAQVRAMIRDEQLRRINQVTGQTRRQLRHQMVEGGCMSCGYDRTDRGGACDWDVMPKKPEGDEAFGGVGGFPHSTGQIEGSPVLAGRGRRMLGGVMRTQAGQQFLKNRLSARVRDLDGIASNVLGADFKPKAEPITEDDRALVSLGESLDIISDGVAVGNYDRSIVEAGRAFLNGLKTIGQRVPQNSITTLLRDLEELMGDILKTYDTRRTDYALSAERKKFARQTYLVLEKARALLKYLTTKSTLSPAERKMALDNYRPETAKQSKSLRELIPNPASYTPSASGDFADIYDFPVSKPSWYR